jgi:hypothetical protein
MNNTLFITQYKIRLYARERKSLSSLLGSLSFCNKRVDIERNSEYNGFHIDMSIPFSESSSEVLSDHLINLSDNHPKVSISGIFEDLHGFGVLSPSLNKEYLTTN